MVEKVSMNEVEKKKPTKRSNELKNSKFNDMPLFISHFYV